MNGNIRHGCHGCVRDDFDGIQSLPTDWLDVHEVQTYHESVRKVNFGILLDPRSTGERILALVHSASGHTNHSQFRSFRCTPTRVRQSQRAMFRMIRWLLCRKVLARYSARYGIHNLPFLAKICH